MSEDVQESLNGELGKKKKPSGLRGLTKGSAQHGDTTVNWAIKPKVKFGELLKGNIPDAFAATKLSLDFTTVCPEDEVTVTVHVNGNAALVLSIPKTKPDFSASFVAEKRF